MSISDLIVQIIVILGSYFAGWYFARKDLFKIMNHAIRTLENVYIGGQEVYIVPLDVHVQAVQQIFQDGFSQGEAYAESNKATEQAD